MDLEPALRFAVRRITQALHHYARDRGWRYAKHADWSQGDYFIEVVVNVDLPRFYVTFVAKAFEAMDGHARFESVQNHLRGELSDEPGLLRAINLVVRDHRQFTEEGGFPLGPSYEPVDEGLIEDHIYT